jgi:hypothetical protein
MKHRPKNIFRSLIAIALCVVSSGAISPQRAVAGPDTPANAVNTADFDAQVQDFLGKELTAHLLAITSLTPPPERVLGVPTTGEFSWGTFMRSLAAYTASTGKRELGGRDIAKWVGQIGLLEAHAGSKAFSQLYAALALRHFGKDLKTNPLWLSLSPEEQTAWRSLLNPERFYDPKTNKVINLPENYLGVASRIASVSYELGVSTDRVFLDRLLDRAAIQFTSGHIYADDSPPAGRYDRYSNEYARYIWEAAEIAGRKDILEKVRPSLNAQMRLWWDLVSEDGYGYNWGRSQGVVSYLDTPEIVGFLADHAEFRPASFAELAALYYQSWRYLHRDFNSETHLLSIFAYGRGNYGYITREREWQQTTGFFGKLANSHTKIINALKREGLASFPVVPTLPNVNRFEYFRKEGERVAGVWVVRQGSFRFALPITTGPKPALSDYLPAPHGLPGFAAPVEQTYPALVPYVELSDGKTIVASDGADSIQPAADGKSLTARWTRWAVIGAASGALSEVGLTSEVIWRIDGNTITREETLSSTQPISIKRWLLIVPSSHGQVETKMTNGSRSDRFISADGTLTVQLSENNFPVSVSTWAAGNNVLGRGVHGAIPLHLRFEARDLSVLNGKPLKYKLSLTSTSSSAEFGSQASGSRAK